MRDAFESWLGREVVVQLGFGLTKVSLRGVFLRDLRETLLLKTKAGPHIEIAKGKVLAIEEVGRTPWPLTVYPSRKSYREFTQSRFLAHVEKRTLGGGSMNKPISILVVSSEIRNCNSLRDILDREGWKSIYASTVGECEEVLVNQNIDLVFCDRSLADGTYRDVLAMTRLKTPCVRLVVTSRLADWTEYLEALDSGAFDLIASPSQTAEIVRVVHQAQREEEVISASALAGPSGLRGRPGLMSAT